jgi:hypothetical protein
MQIFPFIFFSFLFLELILVLFETTVEVTEAEQTNSIGSE